MSAVTARRGLAGVIIGVGLIYVIMAGVPFLHVYMLWAASLFTASSFWFAPFAFIATFVLVLLPIVVLVIGIFAGHYYLCRAFRAGYTID